MIGQKNLLHLINHQIEQNVFPRFSIISGWEHSGKTTLALEISRSLCYYPTVVDDVRIDNIRSIIETAYNTVDAQVYIIQNADTMSAGAENSMLKILEEPPNRAYFILTCNNLDTLLPTIKSRAGIYTMEPYTVNELRQYAESRHAEDIDTIISIASSPGDINILMRTDINDLYEFTNLVLDNICSASISNVLKIGRKIALKKDSDGIDLLFFWLVFIQLCFKRAREHPAPYATWALITAKKISELRRTPAINKSSLFDTWILDIREVEE